MRIIKSLFRLFLSANAKLLLLLFWQNDFWRLKASCQKTSTRIKEIIYFAYLERYGAWIGINSQFESEPILPHGLFGIFISTNAKIGKNVVIFQQVTIGSNNLSDSSKMGSPTIGNDCFIGSGAKIIGNVNVGEGSRIGANCIVVKDVPANSVCVLKGTEIIVRTLKMDNTHKSVIEQN